MKKIIAIVLIMLLATPVVYAQPFHPDTFGEVVSNFAQTIEKGSSFGRLVREMIHNVQMPDQLEGR